MSHLLSKYKYLSEMYILVRIIALIFHCSLSVWRMRAAVLAHSLKSVKFSRESQSSCSSVSKKQKYFHDFITFTGGEYTCEMQVMQYALRETAHFKHIKQPSVSVSGTRSLSVRASDGPSRFNYAKLWTILCLTSLKDLNIKLATYL